MYEVLMISSIVISYVFVVLGCVGSYLLITGKEKSNKKKVKQAIRIALVMAFLQLGRVAIGVTLDDAFIYLTGIFCFIFVLATHIIVKERVLPLIPLSQEEIDHQRIVDELNEPLKVLDELK